jgi:hypothetical protein
VCAGNDDGVGGGAFVLSFDALPDLTDAGSGTVMAGGY